jgi:hypothetical protein
VMFGTDVSVDCIPQRDEIGPLERDGQLVCHLGLRGYMRVYEVELPPTGSATAV